MRLIFIYGLPASGKLTVAQQLASITGYRLAQLRRRMDSPSRFAYQKLTSVALFEELHGKGTFNDSYMPEPRLSVDTSLCTPAEAAAEIARTLQLSRGH